MRNKKRKRYTFAEEEELNPMNYVSNLSDVMLILTVGIMLALILHWDVNIHTDTSDLQGTQASDTVVTFSDNDLEPQTELPENMEQMGEVYYDAATGKYYIVPSDG